MYPFLGVGSTARKGGRGYVLTNVPIREGHTRILSIQILTVSLSRTGIGVDWKGLLVPRHSDRPGVVECEMWRVQC